MSSPVKIAFLTLTMLSTMSYITAQGANNKIILLGSVNDAESNEPLIGANIVIVNTFLGTSSDVEGNFELHINPGR